MTTTATGADRLGPRRCPGQLPGSTSPGLTTLGVPAVGRNRDIGRALCKALAMAGWRSFASVAVVVVTAIVAGGEQGEEPAAGAPIPAASATVTPVFANFAWNVTNCDAVCPGRGLFSDGTGVHSVVLVPSEGATQSISVSKARLVVDGSRSDLTIYPEAVTSADRPDSDGDLVLYVQIPDDLDPDAYATSVVFSPGGEAGDVIVPGTMKVRHGPALPLLVLVVSVVAGFVLTKLLGARPYRDFLTRLGKLDKKIEVLPDVERTIVKPLADATREQRGADFTEAQRRLRALESGVAALIEARNAQDGLVKALKGHRPPVGWLQRVDAAHSALHAAIYRYRVDLAEPLGTIAHEIGVCEQASLHDQRLQVLMATASRARQYAAEYSAFSDVSAALRAALDNVSPALDQAPPELQPLADSVESRFGRLDAAYQRDHGDQPIPVPVVPTLAAGLGPATAATAVTEGIERVPSRPWANWQIDAAAWMARLTFPVIAVIVAALVLLIGFKVSYLDNATFGATVDDWLALVLWGFAAFGARESLTGLPT
jgi:hypothetical protein